MVLLGWAGPALACGGFFCNQEQPVDQTGETIVFESDGETITTHVRLQYSGEAAEFSWVLPTPGVPDVFLSSDGLFDLLLRQTEPVVRLERTADGTCTPWPVYDGDADTDADSDADTDASSFVDVLDKSRVGPYDSVVLDASDPQALTLWLQDNGFTVPDSFAAASAPYLNGGMNFLALKLAKSASVGDLKPLGIRWPGDHPSIPLQLTSVAAVDGLPLTVLVLGPTRAVPLSYLHVQLNPLVYDWFGQNRSWLANVGIAADEAGGRGFATTFAGPTPSDRLYCPASTGLAAIPVPLDWFLAVQSQGFVANDDLLAILRVYVPAPLGVDEIAFYNTPYAYADDWAALQATFDPVAATAALDEQIVAPCDEASAMLTRNAYLTRLTSTISPSEMTVDPVFGFNPDLGDVSNYHEATLAFDCEGGDPVLRLEGGYDLPVDDLTPEAMPTPTWVDAHLKHKALVIEQLSESGPGDVLVDHRDDLAAPPAPDEGSFGGGGCACDTSGGGGVGLGLLALAWVRRRRA